MNQFAAFFAFAVKTHFGTTVAFKTDVFETRRAVRIDYVFAYNTFIYKTFELSVNCRLTDCDPVFFKEFADIVRRYVNAFFARKVLKQDVALFCLVFNVVRHAMCRQNPCQSNSKLIMIIRFLPQCHIYVNRFENYFQFYGRLVE